MPDSATRALHLDAAIATWASWGTYYTGPLEVSDNLDLNGEIAKFIGAGSRYYQKDLKAIDGKLSLVFGLAEDDSNNLGSYIGSSAPLTLKGGAAGATTVFSSTAILSSCRSNRPVGEHATQTCEFEISGTPTTV